jgi:hypothetical protein
MEIPTFGDGGSDCAENGQLGDSMEIPGFDESVGNGAQLVLMTNDAGVNEDPKSYIGRQIAKQYEGIFYVGKSFRLSLPKLMIVLKLRTRSYTKLIMRMVILLNILKA